MDGQNVNLKCHMSFVEEMKKINHDIPDLIDVGLCGLHVVHRALLKGIRKVHGRWISSLNLWLVGCFNILTRDEQLTQK